MSLRNQSMPWNWRWIITVHINRKIIIFLFYNKNCNYVSNARHHLHWKFKRMYLYRDQTRVRKCVFYRLRFLIATYSYPYSEGNFKNKFPVNNSGKPFTIAWSPLVIYEIHLKSVLYVLYLDYNVYMPYDMADFRMHYIIHCYFQVSSYHS